MSHAFLGGTLVAPWMAMASGTSWMAKHGRNTFRPPWSGDMLLKAMGTFCDMNESLKTCLLHKVCPTETEVRHAKSSSWNSKARLLVHPEFTAKHKPSNLIFLLNLKCQMQARGGSASIEFGKLWGRKSPSSPSQKLQNNPPVSGPKSLPYSGDPPAWGILASRPNMAQHLTSNFV